MNRFILEGFISSVKYLPDSCLVFIDDYKKGYRHKDGTIVDDSYMNWKVIFKGYFKDFISKHFNTGMLVDIDAEMKPFAIEHGKIIEGYSCIGLSINLASYPRASVKQEAKMIRESQKATNETPDLDTYNTPDF